MIGLSCPNCDSHNTGIKYIDDDQGIEVWECYDCKEVYEVEDYQNYGSQ